MTPCCLEEAADVHGFSLGDSEEEVAFRQWCYKHGGFSVLALQAKYGRSRECNRRLNERLKVDALISAALLRLLRKESCTR